MARTDQKWYWVEWAPSFELESEVLRTNPTAVEEFRATKREAEAEHNKKRKTWKQQGAQTEWEKQGMYTEGSDTHYNTTIGETVRHKLKVHPHPVNPHTDIHGTGRMEMVHRPDVEYRSQRHTRRI